MSMNLYFNNLASAILYSWELYGQISDGKYENSRPHDHWKWILHTDVIVDPNHPNYTDRYINKKYNLNEWAGYIKSGQEDWARRVLKYVHLANCFESTQENYDKLMTISRTSVDFLPEKEGYTYDKFLKYYEGWPEWKKSENFLKIFTEEVFNKYYATPLSIKEFTTAHTLMKETVNDDEYAHQLREEKKAKKEAEKKRKAEEKKALKQAELQAELHAKFKEIEDIKSQVTPATTEEDLIAPKPEVSSMEVKLEVLKFIKEKYNINVKELSIKL